MKDQDKLPRKLKRLDKKQARLLKKEMKIIKKWNKGGNDTDQHNPG